MKLTKKFTKISLLLGLLGSLGISQEVHAAPPVNFTKKMALDFDMKFPDGSPYNDAQVLVDVKEESTYPTFSNTFIYQNRTVSAVNGNYYDLYGTFNIGTRYHYPADMVSKSYHYLYYTNLRILPKKYVKSIVVGDVKTYHSDGIYYTLDNLWNYRDYENTDYPLPDVNNKFTILGDGTHVWKEANFLTSDHVRPSVEIASVQMGGGFGTSSGAYHLSSIDKTGKKFNLVVNAYQVKENYVDDTGVTIEPPSGFTQGKLTYAKAEQFTHTLNTVPISYTTSTGDTYFLKGSYTGPTKPASLDQSNPPHITVDYTDSSVPNFDQAGQLTVVYALGVKLTEKYVDESGAQIDPAWDPSTPKDIEKNAAFTIPHAIGDTKTDSSGDQWEYVGWKYNTDSAGTKRTTPATGAISGDTTIEYIYKLSKTTASLNLTPNPQIVDNNGIVSWTSRLENTGNAPLKDLILKATSNWAAGLTDPVKVTVTPAGGAPQDFTVNSGDWATGVNLTGITIPNGGPNNYADITFTTTATGAVNQVLPAEIEVAGNIPTPITAENFVRIDDPDEPNLEPSGNAGLINIPDFRFGDVEVKPFAQKKTLDAASYQSGYLPYVRFMDNESNFGWDLTVKLGQFTSGSKTLPTTTTITLRNGILMDVQNYNKFNESFGLVKNEGTKVIPADGATTVQLTDNTARGVYHLEYALNNVELDLMGHSGVAGLEYKATMDWTLTTSI